MVALAALIRPMITLKGKRLLRIRDHFREVGQPASVAFTHVKSDEDPFAADADAKRRFEALFEAMFLMISADGNIADEEREVLRGAVRGLTDHAVRTVYIEKLIEQCQGLAKQGVEERLRAVSPILNEDPALVEAAFSLAAAVAFADSDVTDEENELINQLADALGIDGDKAEELLNQLEAESVD